MKSYRINKRIISRVVVFMFLFNTMFQGIAFKIVKAETNMNYVTVSGNQVTFAVKYDGYDYAFAVGTFNNWGRGDDGQELSPQDFEKKYPSYKLTWCEDTDKQWRMKGNIRLETGKYEYKFKLYRNGNAERWLNKDGGDSNSILVIAPKSPVVNSDRTVTFNYIPQNDGIVSVVGDLFNNNWANDKHIMKKGDDGTYTYTTEAVKPGIYGYKFFIKDGEQWVKDPGNVLETDGNSKLIIPGITRIDVPDFIESGKEAVLSLTSIDNDGQTKVINNNEAKWSINDATLGEITQEGVLKIKDITLDESDIEVKAEKDGVDLSAKIKIKKDTSIKADILSSRNTISKGSKVYLVANQKLGDGSINILNATWRIEPVVNGATIDSAGTVTIDDTVATSTKIKVIATSNGNDVGSKEITVVEATEKEKGNKVQYFRNNNDYNDGWNVWNWGIESGNGANFSEDTDFGKLANIGKNKDFLIRLSKDGNDFKEKTRDMMIQDGENEVFILEGNDKVYTNFSEAIKGRKPRILSAFMDSQNEIKANVPGADKADVNFEVYDNGKKIEGTTFIVEGNKVRITLPATYNLNTGSCTEVKASKIYEGCKVTLRNILDTYVYDGKDLGATYLDNDIQLKLWAPTAAKVKVLIYSSNDEDKESGKAVDMAKDEKSGVWKANIDKDETYGKFYLYKLTFNEVDSTVRETYAVDPYAISVGINGDKGALVAPNDKDTIPDSWNPNSKPDLKKPEDSIISELHVRDFSIDKDSGVDEKNRGKFLGMVQKGTTYKNEGKVKTGLDHLKELGVTHVQLVPVYDYGSVDERNSDERNWGYDPKNYNAIEGSYSTNPSDPKVRMKEFREMVQGFHDAGIRAVMDVVYNHMQNTNNMDNIVPGYYFRTDENGRYTDGSGCGNELASERPMIRKFVKDSIMQWVKNYNIDGFRFDLMELIDLDTIKEIRAELDNVDSSILVYGEPWKGGDSALRGDLHTVKGTQRGNRFGVFNDTFRDALRGNNNPGKGYVTGNFDGKDKIIEGIKGSFNEFTSSPAETMNYVSVHDNHTLWDQIQKSMYPDSTKESYRNIKSDGTEELNDYRVKSDILANGIILLSQGIPVLHGGEELLRTKFGDHNSYKSSDEINEISWKWKQDYDGVFNYYKGLIDIRKNHPAFRMTTVDDIKNNLDIWTAKYNSNIIVFKLKNFANKDNWKNITVIINPTEQDYKFEGEGNLLPTPESGKWNIIADETKAGLDTIETTYNTTTVKPLSIKIMYDKEKGDDIEWNYLYSDQSIDYMSPMEPTSNDDVKVRLRAKKGQLTEAILHYYDEEDKLDHTVNMAKVEDSFYKDKGYEKDKLEFWEGVIPHSKSRKYYRFEVKNATNKVWIVAGTGDNGKGVSNSDTGKGFWLVPDYKTSNWAKESVLYQIMPDRFRDGDKSNNRRVFDISQGGSPSEILKWGQTPYIGKLNVNGNVVSEGDGIWNNEFYGGDLVGVRQAVPYLKNILGVTGIYLMPSMESPSNHKYDISDYEHIDKHFGGNKALKSLSNDVHNSGMSMVLDGVFNHTSDLNPWFKEAKKDPNSAFRNRYFFDSQGNYHGWNGQTTLPKLNYSNEDVKNYIFNGENSIVKKYLKAPYNLDGWRMDAAEDISGTPTEYKNGGEEHKNSNLNIWAEINKSIKETNPNAFIFGEYWGEDNQWFDGNHWDGKMNYSGFQMPFVENRGENHWLGLQSLDNNGGVGVGEIGKFTRNNLSKYPYQTTLNSTNSISTHDKPRFLDWNYTGKGNEQMMELAAALQMTYVGIPMIYYGDEVGLASDKLREDKSADPYNRGTFNWDTSSWNKNMLDDYRKLIKVRKDNSKAFVYGAFEEIKSHNDDKYIAYARYGENEKSMVVLNNSGANGTKNVELNELDRYGFKEGDRLKEILTGKEVVVENNSITVASKDMSASVYVLADKYSTIPTVDEAINENSLNNCSDDRKEVAKIEGLKTEVISAGTSNTVIVKWNKYEDGNAKNLNIKLYDEKNNKVIEQVVALDKTECEFKVAGDVKGYVVAINAEADRSRAVDGIDDQYMDSSYVTLNLSSGQTVEEKKEPQVKVSELTFKDTDGDKNEIGGKVTWKLESEDNVSGYTLYFMDKDNNKIAKIGEVTKGVSELIISENTKVAETSCKISVYAHNETGESKVFEVVNIEDYIKQAEIPVKPDKPEVPSKPDKPVEPTKPEVPSKPNKPIEPTKPEVPSKPDNNGKAKGWIKNNSSWYYKNQDGSNYIGWLKDNSKWYYLGSNGAMKTGWVKDEGRWYYLDLSGAMKTGWVKEKGKWYYMDLSGAMRTDWVKDNGVWYYLNSDGAMKTGWIKYNSQWYYLNSDGSMKVNGWILDNRNWYYVNNEGIWVA